MSYQAAVPEFFGVYIHVWLGGLLAALVAFQITTGVLMTKGKGYLLKYHRVNAVVVVVVLIIHAYYGYLFTISAAPS